MALQDNSTSMTVRHRFSGSSSSFLTQIGGGAGGMVGAEQEIDVIMLDHCYTKPWSAHPDASSARPVRMLFMPKQTRPSALEMLHRTIDPPIDVVDTPPAPSMPFDINKARNLMTECERHAAYARPDSQEDWEDKISKVGWSIPQNRVFTKVVKALQADRLARLATDMASNEPIARRQIVEKTAKRLRQALASVGWDTKVVQWLHQLILDMVSIHLLASYLDALQTLKAKIPALVEKMLGGAPPKHPSLSQESLGLLLKRPWDPVGNVLTQHKLKKLPGNPLLLLAPSGPTQGSSSSSGQAKRLKFWQMHLNSLGKTIPTNMSGGSGVSVVLCLEQMIGALRTKVLEQKSHHPGRPVILIGWNIGALVACHVSLVESVSAVVCLGFPFTGTHGPRGDCEDPLLGSQTPTLFVIGQNAGDCSIDQLQDLREHMHAETGMLVVGGADELLRLSHRQKRDEGLTQSMADRCILDEVYQFLGSILSMNTGIPDLPAADVAQADLRRKRKRRLSRDLSGGIQTENRLSTSMDRDPSITSFSQPPVMGSGTGRVSKRGGKAARMLNVTGRAAVASEGGKSGPKKRVARGGMGPGARKRIALGMSQFGVHATKSGGGRQPGSANALSTVANAPELSGLLQGIRVSRPADRDSFVVGGARSLMGTPLPLNKVLSLSKLMDVNEAGVGSSGSASGATTLLASAVRSSDSEDRDKLVQQGQLLVKAGVPSSVPPRWNSPVIHITGTGPSSSSQIHQLLTSVSRHAASTVASAPALLPQTALLLSTSTASSVPTAGLTQQTDGGEKGVLEKSGPPEVSDSQGQVDKGDGVGGESGKGKVSTGRSSSQLYDLAMTSSSLMSRSAIATQASLAGQAVAADPSLGAVQAQAARTSMGVSGDQATLTSSVFGADPASLASQTSVAASASLQAQSSLSGQSLTSAAAGASQAMTGETALTHMVPLTKSGIVQLAVTKSLISSATGSTHSILGKVVAASMAKAGSPTAASSVLDGRSAVLISPSIAQSLSSAPTTILLNKPSSGPSSLAATFKPGVEMLGKVSSVLEPSASVRHLAQTSTGAASLVTVPFSLAKPGIISAINASKQVGGPTSQGPPASVSASFSAVTTAPASPTVTSPSGTGAGGGGRGGHKSGSAASYAASSKPVLPTPTSTRTRKIRTPKQYDL